MGLVSLSREILGLADNAIGLGVVSFKVLKVPVDSFAVLKSLCLSVRLVEGLLLQAIMFR